MLEKLQRGGEDNKRKTEGTTEIATGFGQSSLCGGFEKTWNEQHESGKNKFDKLRNNRS